jgi:hypothetical protein
LHAEKACGAGDQNKLFVVHSRDGPQCWSNPKAGERWPFGAWASG